jgi:hypothetical protein
VETLRAQLAEARARAERAEVEASEEVSPRLDPAVGVPWMRCSPDLPRYVGGLEQDLDAAWKATGIAGAVEDCEPAPAPAIAAAREREEGLRGALEMAAEIVEEPSAYVEDRAARIRALSPAASAGSCPRCGQPTQGTARWVTCLGSPGRAACGYRGPPVPFPVAPREEGGTP